MKHLEKILLAVVLVIVVVASFIKKIEGSEYIALVLVIITAYYAFQTHKHNQIFKDNSRISNRPYLALITINHTAYNFSEDKPNNICLQLELELMNVGIVPLKFNMKEIDITINDKANKDKKYDNVGNYIFPSQKTIFYCELTPEIELDERPLSGFIEYELEYFSTMDNNNIYKSRKKIKYTVLDKIRWVYLEEDEN